MNQHRPPSAKVMTALLTPRPGNDAEFSQMLTGLRDAIVGASGCIECLIAQDVGAGARYVLVSAWRDAGSLEDHLRSEHFRILRGAADVLASQTDLRFVTGDAVRSATAPVRR